MSYAIIRTGGKQFRVEPGKKYRIPTIVGDAGGSIQFNDVLLRSDGQKVRTGIPSLSGAQVTREIVKHRLGGQIIGFKIKGREKQAEKQGHRPRFTETE